MQKRSTEFIGANNALINVRTGSDPEVPIIAWRVSKVLRKASERNECRWVSSTRRLLTTVRWKIMMKNTMMKLRATLPSKRAEMNSKPNLASPSKKTAELHSALGCALSKKLFESRHGKKFQCKSNLRRMFRKWFKRRVARNLPIISARPRPNRIKMS